ncbi:unnamed protein product [Albugo candida]|uniref:Uncharacterized protein n=1 Tax=Albugo candida TaxID=65357 RepID=A0A024GL51_9STRA|nr:unnamed protein product [Albugo candida]|eukprot:CCI47424.1 unnamed protein product [Albugo candida]
MGLCGSRSKVPFVPECTALDLGHGDRLHDVTSPLNTIATNSTLQITGPLCVAGWDDGTIQVVDTEKQLAIVSFQGHEKSINRVVLGCNSVYTCSRDRTIAMHSISVQTKDTGDLGGEIQPLEVFSGHSLNVSGLSVDTMETTMCSGSRDTEIILWDISTTKIIARNKTSQNVVTCCKYVSTEPVVAQTSEDLTIRVWDTRCGLRAPVQVLYGYVYFALDLDVSMDSFYFLTSSKGFNGFGGEVRVWDRRNGKEVAMLCGHQQDATACCFLPNLNLEKVESQYIPISASKDGTVRIWDANKKVAVGTFQEQTGGMFTSVCVANGTTVLASTLQGRIRSYDLPSSMKSQTEI